MTWLTTLAATFALLATAIVSNVPAASAAAKASGHPVAPVAVKPDNQVTSPDAMADLATARREHTRVEIVPDHTAFSRTYANPDGTLTTVESPQPRWVERGKSWIPASADLVRGSSGWWSPKAAEAGLRLSGGGSNVLATLGSGSRAMSVAQPHLVRYRVWRDQRAARTWPRWRPPTEPGRSASASRPGC